MRQRGEESARVMADVATVTLAQATHEDAERLGNLMQLYIHDLCAIFPQVELDANGRFAYPSLPEYLEGGSKRRAFLIHVGERLAGFVLAQRGSPFTDDPEVWDIAEFFVLRRYRGGGVGRDAAESLWRLLPGRWTVRAIAKNPDAVRFWRRVTATYTHGDAKEQARLASSQAWTVFSFASPEP